MTKQKDSVKDELKVMFETLETREASGSIIAEKANSGLVRKLSPYFESGQKWLRERPDDFATKLLSFFQMSSVVRKLYATSDYASALFYYNEMKGTYAGTR